MIFEVFSVGGPDFYLSRFRFMEIILTTAPQIVNFKN